MREAVAFVYGWPPDMIDGFPLSKLARWASYADARIQAHGSRRCAFLK